MITAILERCNTIEECYETMLAYAAKGFPADPGAEADSSIRECLRRAVRAVEGLAERCAVAVREERLEPAQPYLAFVSVLERDAADSLAAMELVLAQPSISSQLVDNLNASIHLRALLTDVFLLGDTLRSRTIAATR
jgi:hypothetical protein